MALPCTFNSNNTEYFFTSERHYPHLLVKQCLRQTPMFYRPLIMSVCLCQHFLHRFWPSIPILDTHFLAIQKFWKHSCILWDIIQDFENFYIYKKPLLCQLIPLLNKGIGSNMSWEKCHLWEFICHSEWHNLLLCYILVLLPSDSVTICWRMSW